MALQTIKTSGIFALVWNDTKHTYELRFFHRVGAEHDPLFEIPAEQADFAASRLKVIADEMVRHHDELIGWPRIDG